MLQDGSNTDRLLPELSDESTGQANDSEGSVVPSCRDTGL